MSDAVPVSLNLNIKALRGALKAEESELVIDPDLDALLDDVRDFAGMSLKDMVKSQLDTVWEALRGVEAAVNSANKMFAMGRQATIAEVSDALLKENKGLTKEAAERLRVWDRAHRLINLDMLTPETYFHRLGKTGDRLFRMLRDAQDEFTRISADIAEFTDKTAKRYNIDAAALENEKKTVTLGGKKVKMTTAQLMKLYALARREQAVQHIMLGGIVPSSFTDGVKELQRIKPVKGITWEDIANVKELLTEDQKKFVQVMQNYQSDTLGAYGNRASMEVYGYKKFNEKYYSAIRSNYQELETSAERATRTASVANRGMTKATIPNASTSVRVDSFFDDFAVSAVDMATYSAWLAAEADIARVLNHKFRNVDGGVYDTMKGLLDGVYKSGEGSKYLEKLLVDIAVGIQGVRGDIALGSGFAGRFKTAAVGANLRVIAQQPTAILRAADMISPKYLMAGAF
jgi:hypothetical protein